MIQALLDSCVILPMPLCDTLMRAAEKPFYRIHFSQKILDDVSRNLVRRRKVLPEKAERHQQYILQTFPEALVEVSNHLIGKMTNDPGDRHVLAAAVVAEVDVIVTSNVKDFPQESLDPWGIEVQHPDDFLCSLCEIHSDGALYELIQEQANDCKNPPQTELELLEKLERTHPIFVARLLAYNHASEIERIAKRALTTIGEVSPDGGRHYNGTFYSFSLAKERIQVTDKLDGSELLNAYKGEGLAALTVKDVLRFQEFDKKMEEVLAQ